MRESCRQGGGMFVGWHLSVETVETVVEEEMRPRECSFVFPVKWESDNISVYLEWK